MYKSGLRNFPLHVFFFSAIPLLILLNNNLGQVELSEAIRPLIFSTLLAVILLLALGLLQKDWKKAGLFVTWTLLIFFSYGHIYEVSKGFLLYDILLGRHRYLIVLWVVFYGFGAFVINRRLTQIEGTTFLLNGVSFLLLVLQVIRLSVYEIKSQISYRHAETAARTTLLNPDNLEELPDVYLIVLDMYGREDALMAHYNYDNHEFVSNLEDLGFYVASCGRSNYSKTVLSLPSQLNMEYVDNLIEDPNHEKYAYLLKNSRIQ
jgi:hypothetical protein